jgi:hypothetical protein
MHCATFRAWRQVRRSRQFAESAAPQRPGYEQGPGDMTIAANGMALQVDVDAETQRIGAGEADIADLREQRGCCEHRAVRRAGCDHDRVECLASPLTAAARPQVECEVMTLRCADVVAERRAGGKQCAGQLRRRIARRVSRRDQPLFEVAFRRDRRRGSGM